MILLIDAGNTRVKLSWLGHDGRRVPRVEAIPHVELTQRLPAWLEALPTPATKAVGVNVAGPQIQAAIEGALQTVSSCTIQWQRSLPAFAGLINGYAQPAQLGTDRWLALLGWWAGTTRPVLGTANTPARVLASFGTATTVDAITPDGVFAGGVILPGPQMMLASLASGTANLPLATGTVSTFPTDTNSAIVTGVAASQAGAVVRQLLALRQLYPGHPLLLGVAGGAWPSVAAELHRQLALTQLTLHPEFVDNPVLDGLAVVARTAAA